MQVTRLITLKADAVPAGRGTRIVDVSPVTGIIDQILIHFPPGVNGLVDVAIGHGSVWVAPAITKVQSESYIALNAATPVFDTQEPVNKDEQLWLIVRNRDAVNPHTITAVLVCTGEET
jgi:hypothetical protein